MYKSRGRGKSGGAIISQGRDDIKELLWGTRSRDDRFPWSAIPVQLQSNLSKDLRITHGKRC
jgi:hypothetical protein